MLDDNEMVYPERHCCPDALSEIRMMKAMSSDLGEWAKFFNEFGWKICGPIRKRRIAHCRKMTVTW